jgi:hypothetical protein
MTDTAKKETRPECLSLQPKQLLLLMFVEANTLRGDGESILQYVAATELHTVADDIAAAALTASAKADIERGDALNALAFRLGDHLIFGQVSPAVTERLRTMSQADDDPRRPQ